MPLDLQSYAEINALLDAALSKQQGTRAPYTDAELDAIYGPQTPPTSGGFGRRMLDYGVTGLKGAIGVPDTALGILNIPTMGYAGKAAEAVGYNSKKAQEILDSWYSDPQKEANKKVREAFTNEGFLSGVGTAIRNPSTIFHSALESAPTMLGAGAIGRGALAGISRLAPTLGEGTAAALAGGIGEGLVTTGQNLEQLRQQNPTGLVDGKDIATQLAAGTITGAIGMGSGKIANRLGFVNPEEALATGKFTPLGGKFVDAAGNELKAPGLLKRLAGGALTEGVLEELPQSAQEQMWQNVAQEKPFGEGVGEAAGMGMLAGGLMGAGFNLKGQPTPLPPAPEVRDDGKDSDLLNGGSVDDQIKAAIPNSQMSFDFGVDMAGNPIPNPGDTPNAPEVDPVTGKVVTRNQFFPQTMEDTGPYDQPLFGPASMEQPQELVEYTDAPVAEQAAIINPVLDKIFDASLREEIAKKVKDPSNQVDVNNQLGKIYEAAVRTVNAPIQSIQGVGNEATESQAFRNKARATYIKTIMETSPEFNRTPKVVEALEKQQKAQEKLVNTSVVNPITEKIHAPEQFDLFNPPAPAVTPKGAKATQPKVEVGETLENAPKKESQRARRVREAKEFLIANGMTEADLEGMSSEGIDANVARIKKEQKAQESAPAPAPAEPSTAEAAPVAEAPVAPAPPKASKPKATPPAPKPKAAPKTATAGFREILGLKPKAAVSDNTASETHSDEVISKVVEVVNKLTGGKANLEFVEGKLVRSDLSGRQVEIGGETLGNLITLTMRAKNIEDMARHEVIHTLKNMGLFTPQEWHILTTKANAWIKKYNIHINYKNLTKEEQLEEAIAHAFADKGYKADSFIGKIRNFIEQLWNYIKGLERASAADVFERVESGKVGGRPWDGVLVDDIAKPAMLTDVFADHLRKIRSSIMMKDTSPLAGEISAINDNKRGIKYSDIKGNLKKFLTAYDPPIQKHNIKELADHIYNGHFEPMFTSPDTPQRTISVLEAYVATFNKIKDKYAGRPDTDELDHKIPAATPIKTVGELREFADDLETESARVLSSWKEGKFFDMLEALDIIERMGFAPERYYGRSALIKGYVFYHFGTVSMSALPEWMIFTNADMFRALKKYQEAYKNRVNFYVGANSSPENLAEDVADHIANNPIIQDVMARMKGESYNDILVLDGSPHRTRRAMHIIHMLNMAGAVLVTESYGKPLGFNVSRKSASRGGNLNNNIFLTGREALPAAEFSDLLESLEMTTAERLESETIEQVNTDPRAGSMQGVTGISRDAELYSPEMFGEDGFEKGGRVADTKGHTEEIPTRTEGMNLTDPTKGKLLLIVNPNAVQQIRANGWIQFAPYSELRRAYIKMNKEYKQTRDNKVFLDKYMQLLTKYLTMLEKAELREEIPVEVRAKINKLQKEYDRKQNPMYNKFVAALEEKIAKGKKTLSKEELETLNLALATYKQETAEELEQQIRELKEPWELDSFEKLFATHMFTRSVNGMRAPVAHSFALSMAIKDAYRRIQGSRSSGQDVRGQMMSAVAEMAAIHKELYGVFPLTITNDTHLTEIFNHITVEAGKAFNFLTAPTTEIVLSDEDKKRVEWLMNKAMYDKNEANKRKLLGSMKSTSKAPEKVVAIGNVETANLIVSLLTKFRQDIEVVEIESGIPAKKKENIRLLKYYNKPDEQIGVMKELLKFLDRIQAGFAANDSKRIGQVNEFIALVKEELTNNTPLTKKMQTELRKKLLKNLNSFTISTFLQDKLDNTPTCTVPLGSMFEEFSKYSEETKDQIRTLYVPYMAAYLSREYGLPISYALTMGQDKVESAIFWVGSDVTHLNKKTPPIQHDMKPWVPTLPKSITINEQDNDLTDADGQSFTSANIIGNTLSSVEQADFVADIEENLLRSLVEGQDFEVVNVKQPQTPRNREDLTYTEFIHELLGELNRLFTKEEIQIDLSEKPKYIYDVIMDRLNLTVSTGTQSYTTDAYGTVEIDMESAIADYQSMTKSKREESAYQAGLQRVQEAKREQEQLKKIQKAVDNALIYTAKYLHGYAPSRLTKGIKKLIKIPKAPETTTSVHEVYKGNPKTGWNPNSTDLQQTLTDSDRNRQVSKGEEYKLEQGGRTYKRDARYVEIDGKFYRVYASTRKEGGGTLGKPLYMNNETEELVWATATERTLGKSKIRLVRIQNIDSPTATPRLIAETMFEKMYTHMDLTPASVSDTLDVNARIGAAQSTVQEAEFREALSQLSTTEEDAVLNFFFEADEDNPKSVGSVLLPIINTIKGRVKKKSELPTAFRTQMPDIIRKMQNTAFTAQELIRTFNRLMNDDIEMDIDLDAVRGKAEMKISEVEYDPKRASVFNLLLEKLEDYGFVTTSVPRDTSLVGGARTKYGNKYMITPKFIKFIVDTNSRTNTAPVVKAAVMNPFEVAPVAGVVDRIAPYLNPDGSVQGMKGLWRAIKSMLPAGVKENQILSIIKHIGTVPYFEALKIFKKFGSKAALNMMKFSNYRRKIVEDWKGEFGQIVAPFKAKLEQMSPEMRKRLNDLFVWSDANQKVLTLNEAQEKFKIDEVAYKFYKDFRNEIKTKFPEIVQRAAATAYITKFATKIDQPDLITKVLEKIGKHNGALSEKEARALAKEIMPEELDEKWQKRFVSHVAGYNDYLGSIKANIDKITFWMPRIRVIKNYTVKAYDKDKKKVAHAYFNTLQEAQEYADKLKNKDRSVWGYKTIPEGDITAYPELTADNKYGLFSTMDSAQEFHEMQTAFDADNAHKFDTPWFGNSTLDREEVGTAHSYARRNEDLILGYDTTDFFTNYTTAFERIAMSYARLEYGQTQLGHLDNMRQDAKKDPRLHPHVAVFTKHLTEELKRPDNLARIGGHVRKLTAFYYMGFGFVGALINATQPFTVGAPALAKMYTEQEGGSYAKNMARALNDVRKWTFFAGKDIAQHYLKQGHDKTHMGKVILKSMETLALKGADEFKTDMPEHMRKALEKFSRGGLMAGVFNDATFVNSLEDEYQKGDRGKVFKLYERVFEESLATFKFAEIVNREGSFLAAYDYAYRNAPEGVDKEKYAFTKAEEYVFETQYLTNKFNQPLTYKQLGGFGDAAYALMSYPFNMINQLFTYGKDALRGDTTALKTIGAILLMIFAIGGSDGLPGEDIVAVMWKKLASFFNIKGMSGDLKTDKNRILNSLNTPDKVKDFVNNGLPSLIGLNFSKNVQLNTPFFSMFLDKTPAESMSGASGGLAVRLGKGVTAALEGDTKKWIENMSPEFIARVSRAVGNTEGVRTKSGTQVYVDGKPQVLMPHEAVLAAGGLKTQRWAELQAAKQSEASLKKTATEKRDKARKDAIEQKSGKPVAEYQKWLTNARLHNLAPNLTSIEQGPDKNKIAFQTAERNRKA